MSPPNSYCRQNNNTAAEHSVLSPVENLQQPQVNSGSSSGSHANYTQPRRNISASLPIEINHQSSLNHSPSAPPIPNHLLGLLSGGSPHAKYVHPSFAQYLMQNTPSSSCDSNDTLFYLEDSYSNNEAQSRRQDELDASIPNDSKSQGARENVCQAADHINPFSAKKSLKKKNSNSFKNYLKNVLSPKTSVFDDFEEMFGD